MDGLRFSKFNSGNFLKVYVNISTIDCATSVL